MTNRKRKRVDYFKGYWWYKKKYWEHSYFTLDGCM